MTQPPPPPADASEPASGGGWKTWQLAVAAGLALLVGIGLGGLGGDDVDGEPAAADAADELETEIELLESELDERDQALADAAERAEAASDGEGGSSDPDDSAGDAGGDAGDDTDTLAIGQTGIIGDYEVTVTGFTADDTEAVLAANQFNEEPEHGVYGTVTFDATYIGDGEGMPGFDLSAALVIDGVQHGDTGCSAVVENDAINAPTLENGGTAAGQAFCFDHPGLNDSAALFFDETVSFDDTRVYWEVG